MNRYIINFNEELSNEIDKTFNNLEIEVDCNKSTEDTVIKVTNCTETGYLSESGRILPKDVFIRETGTYENFETSSVDAMAHIDFSSLSDISYLDGKGFYFTIPDFFDFTAEDNNNIIRNYPNFSANLTEEENKELINILKKLYSSFFCLEFLTEDKADYKTTMEDGRKLFVLHINIKEITSSIQLVETIEKKTREKKDEFGGTSFTPYPIRIIQDPEKEGNLLIYSIMSKDRFCSKAIINKDGTKLYIYDVPRMIVPLNSVGPFGLFHFNLPEELLEYEKKSEPKNYTITEHYYGGKKLNKFLDDAKYNLENSNIGMENIIDKIIDLEPNFDDIVEKFNNKKKLVLEYLENIKTKFEKMLLSLNEYLEKDPDNNSRFSKELIIPPKKCIIKEFVTYKLLDYNENNITVYNNSWGADSYFLTGLLIRADGYDPNDFFSFEFVESAKEEDPNYEVNKEEEHQSDLGGNLHNDYHYTTSKKRVNFYPMINKYPLTRQAIHFKFKRPIFYYGNNCDFVFEFYNNSGHRRKIMLDFECSNFNGMTGGLR